jgi:hypothetical protein
VSSGVGKGYVIDSGPQIERQPLPHNRKIGVVNGKRGVICGGAADRERQQGGPQQR